MTAKPDNEVGKKRLARIAQMLRLAKQGQVTAAYAWNLLEDNFTAASVKIQRRTFTK
jgi:hypothetical protein